MRTKTVRGDTPFTLTPEACEALGDDPVPVDSCTSQEYFEKERDQLFRKSWLCVGREEQIPKAGDYFVKEMELFSTSLLITRGRDGVVRGFHNVCSHRCNKLVWDESGSSRSFVCRFHGWTYQTDGALRHVPEEEIFPPVDQVRDGLAPVATDVWRGFIFVKMDDSSGVGLQEFMAPFADTVAAFPFEKYNHCYAYRTTVNANWKLVMDAFLESFHVRFLHQQTVSEIFRHSKDEQAADAFGIEVFARHGRYSVPGIAGSRSHPVEDLVVSSDLSFYRNLEDADAAPLGLNRARGANWAFDSLLVFPNTLWGLGGGASYIHVNVLPLGPDRTLFEGRSYSPPARDGLERFIQEYNQILGRDTTSEDASTLEVTQAVLASGAKPTMILGDQDILVRQLHHVVDQVVNGAEASIA